MTGAPKAWPRLPDPGLDLSGPKGPRSSRYDDGYASAAGAAEETDLVFLQAIGAPDVWRGRDTFCIGETGFGLGLNFLMTWAAWRRTAPQSAQLHFASIEGFPLTRDEMAAALEPYFDIPGLKPLARALTAHYPIRHAGYHRLSLDDGRVKLTLLFGPVEEVLPKLTARMDAWYLDGFSPAKNPDMWSADTLRDIAERTRPGGAVVTYTAAGAVRRALSAAGFAMEKRPGFAGKRDRLVGVMTGPPAARPASAPWFSIPAHDTPPAKSVAIVGGGIAGQWLNKALQERGIVADLFDKAGAAGGMTGNPAALLVPKLHVQPTPAGRLHASAFLHALRSYDSLPAAIWCEPRGARLALKDETRAERTVAGLGWPNDILALDTAGGSPVQVFGGSGALDTDAVKAALAPEIAQWAVSALHATEAGWRLEGPDGNTFWEGDAVIVAAGGWSGRLLDAPWLNIRPSRGQVSFLRHLPDTLPAGSSSFDGYITPALTLPDGSTGRILGSSFDELRRPDEDSTWQTWSAGDHRRYAATFAAHYDVGIPAAEDGWVGLRATTPDRLPVAGPIPDRTAYRADYPDLHQGKHWKEYPPARYRRGLYILSGLGARGYQFAPLLAELLADRIAGTPLPLPSDLIDAVHPARFLIRDLIKNSA